MFRASFLLARSSDLILVILCLIELKRKGFLIKSISKYLNLLQSKLKNSLLYSMTNPIFFLSKLISDKKPDKLSSKKDKSNIIISIFFSLRFILNSYVSDIILMLYSISLK